MIVFRADASFNIGGGHIYRCLTLAKALQKQGRKQGQSWPIIFICHITDGHMGDLIEQSGFKLLGVEKPLDIVTVRAQLVALQQNYGPIEWLIIDHYQINKHHEQQLKPLVKQLMVIDDLANRGHVCDLLFDQSLNRHPSDYQPWLTQNHCEIICGSQFALLRDEFKQLQPQAKIKRQQCTTINKVLIAISATDPDNISAKVLNTLEHADPSSIIRQWQYTLVLTSKAKHLDDIKTRVSQSTLNIKLKLDVSNMAAAIIEQDIAIAAAGGAMLERCALGLPSIIIAVVDNQQHILEALAKHQVSIDLLAKNELNQRLISTLENFDIDNYQTLSKNAFKLCRGDGADFVAGKITNSKTNNLYLQAITHNYCELLFEWQNHPATRAYARNPEPPTWQQHQHWFSNIINNPEVDFYLVMQHNKAVGFVRLHPKTLNNLQGTVEGKEVSIAIAPDSHQQGLGQQALVLLRQLHRDSKLLAYIDDNNSASIKAFNRAGFKALDQHNDNGWYQYP